MDTFAFHGLDPIRAWGALAPLLPVGYRALAVEHRQLQTQYGNAKITSADELLRFVLAYAGANYPLRHVVAEMEAAGAPRLSAMRLHMKLRQAVPYLHALLQRMVPECAALNPEVSRGLEFVYVNSVPVVGPSSTQAPERLHAAMVLHDARIDAVAMSDPSELDAVRQFFWNPRQVATGHAASATGSSVARAVTQGAHVLLEVDATSPLLFVNEDGDKVDPGAFARGLRAAPAGTGARARRVDLRVDDARRVAGRLVAATRGDEPAALFTTIPPDLMERDQLALFSSRAGAVSRLMDGWRREGARLSNQRDDTTTAWVYARVLLGLLEQRAHDVAA